MFDFNIRILASIKIPRNIRSVASLSGINILSQLIPFLLLPIFSNFYSNMDFSLYGFSLAIASPLAILLSLRYENAIVPSKSLKQAIDLVYLCVLLISFISLLCFILIYFFSEFILASFNLNDEYYPYLLMAPIISLTMAFAQVLNLWWIKFLKIRYINGFKFAQATFFSLTVLLFGYSAINHGLIYSDLLSRIITVIILGLGLLIILIRHQKPLLSNIAKAAVLNNNFPLQNAIPALLDSISLSMIVWFVTLRYNQAISGNFNLARMVIIIPMSVLTVAIGQVFLNYYSKRLIAKLPLWPIIIKHFQILFLLGVVAGTIYYFIGAEVFYWIFGSKWKSAAILSTYLMCSSLIKICVSPLSVALIAYKDLKLLSLWQVLSFICYVSMFCFEFCNIFIALSTLLAMEFALYGIFLYFIFITIKKNDRLG